MSYWQSPFHKKLFVLAVPMILSNITVPLLGLVDTAVIGHLPHAYLLGGSAVGAMIISLVTWLCGFLRMTTTGLAAQALGQKDHHKSVLVLLRGLLVAFFVAALMLLSQSIYIDTALNLAGGSSQVTFYARQYAEIRVWGYPASLANIVMIGWLLGNHQTKAVMWMLIVTNLINIVLDVLFVMGFAWQIAGIAYATVIAEYSGFLLGVWLIIRSINSSVGEVVFSGKHMFDALFERHAILHYFKLNRDILIRTLCLQLCFVFMTFQGARLGDNVVAANAILMNFLLFISFGLDGIANAAEIMVGKAKGQNSIKALKKITLVALFWTTIFALAYCVVFWLAGDYLVGLISTIPSVVNYANEHLFWLILLPIVACWCYLFDGIYIGLTYAKTMRNSMVISTFCCFFPAWFLLQHYDNNGLWAAFMLFMFSRGIGLGGHFYQHVWHKKSLAD